MRASLHPRLINGRSGDPGVYVEILHQADAILLDCGDLSALAARHLLRIGVVAVSHAHMDHWAGFDQLLRVLIGREKLVAIIGPEGFAERVYHRLQAYTWNLVHRIPADLVFEVIEVGKPPPLPRTRMRLHTGFQLEPLPPLAVPAGGPILQVGTVGITAAVLDHGMPCLGFALQESAHVNVWRTKLDARGLPTGPWLNGLKQAILENQADDFPVPVFARASEAGAPRMLPLRELRDVVEVTRGQRLAYLTDFADTAANRAAATALAFGADILFIEAPFAAEDAEVARDRCHLTTQAAGEIARAAGARRIEPFHFSPRYPGGEPRLLAEVASFAGSGAM